jgi:hypothetical protein
VSQPSHGSWLEGGHAERRDQRYHARRPPLTFGGADRFVGINANRILNPDGTGV